MEPRIKVINEFLEEQIEHFATITHEMESPESDVDALDDLFRELLNTVRTGKLTGSESGFAVG